MGNGGKAGAEVDGTSSVPIIRSSSSPPSGKVVGIDDSTVSSTLTPTSATSSPFISSSSRSLCSITSAGLKFFLDNFLRFLRGPEDVGWTIDTTSLREVMRGNCKQLAWCRTARNLRQDDPLSDRGSLLFPTT